MRKKLLLKAVTLTVLAVMTAGFTACGVKESEKVYLDEIQAEKYVKLGEYKGLEVAQEEPQVTDEYRDAYINYLLCLDPEEGVKEGDTVNIDYVGTLDGVAFEGGTASGQNLTIGSNQFIEGFESGLIGAKTGDSVELNLTFPADYSNKDLAGKEVVFMVTVNSIMSSTPKELTDEYVKSLELEGCSNVEEYKQFVYDMLYEEETKTYERTIENTLVSDLLTKCEFTKEPPQAMMDRYAKTITARLTTEAESYGRTLEDYMQLAYGMDAATYAEEIKSQALIAAQQYIMLQAIADKEKLNVTDEEVKAEMEEVASGAGYESVDEFKELVNEDEYKEYMMGQNVMKLIRENAVIMPETTDTAEATDTSETTDTAEAAE